ncbi:MAG: pacearchaeosortase [Nanoarchaeota archaeon]|nr:pacearchaeosortase [Nanoarchaeota archaeon]
MSKYIRLNKFALSLCLRYVVLLIIALNLDLIYNIFTPLTLNLSNTLLGLFYETLIDNNSIFIDTFEIKLIPACIAGSAYLLLLILNLSTEIDFKKRVKSLLFILSSFLLINVLRITFLTYLFKESLAYSNLAHEISWYLGSTVILVIIWFVNVTLFNIKNIPVFTDVKYLFSQVKGKNHSKRL